MKQIEAKRNTIIYGGAFNPPTRAHQAILQACVDHAEAIGADVWIMPSGSRTDKMIEKTRADRLRMVEALCRDVVTRTVELHIETCELDRDKPVETYDTVIELGKMYDDKRFLWVFGSDSVATMPEWHGGDWLQHNLSMLVIERPGSPLQDLDGDITELCVAPTDVSSTEVRARLAANEPVDDLVGPEVLACLKA